MSNSKRSIRAVGVATLMVGAFFGGIIPGCSIPAAQAQADVKLPSPQEELRITIDALVSTVEQIPGKDQSVKRKHELRLIINPRFDFAEMSTRSLGALWKDLTPDQKSEFTSIFSDLLARTYLNRIETIERGMVVIEGEKIYPASGTTEARAIVKTMVTQNGDRFPILYKVVFHNGKWQVYDVVIENVGLVANYRNEFSGIVRREGFSGLMDRLRAKLKE